MRCVGNEGQAQLPARGSRWLTSAAAYLRTLTLRRWFVGAFLVVLALSLPFGGLQAVEPPDLPTLVVGKPTTVEPFTVTVTRVRHGDDLGVAQARKTPGRYVVVFATVTTTAQDRSVPVQTVKELLRIEGVSGVSKGFGSLEPQPVSDQLAPDSVLVATDAEPMGDLAPGLRYDLAFIWLQTPGQPVPAQVRVAAYRHTWRASSIDQELGWRDATRAAVGTIPASAYQKPAP